jgi:hypothetical protein
VVARFVLERLATVQHREGRAGTQRDGVGVSMSVSDPVGQAGHAYLSRG